METLAEKSPRKKNQIVLFFLSLALPVGAGVIAALFSRNAKQVYGALIKPAFAPPAAVFAPVWTVLYILMGVALFLVLREGVRSPRVKSAFFYFCVQLFFNVLWSLLFFTLEMRAAALIDLLILICYLTITTVKFFKINRAAGILLLPYLAWCLYAAALNFMVVMKNG